MSEYDSFSIHYDTLMGTRDECVSDVRKLLRTHAPRAKSILELGCGTGSVLKQLRKTYDVAGVDLSAGMLNIARKKLPGIPLKQMNIAKLEGVGKFDAVLCLFDTMNHLPRFSDWKEVMKRAHATLNPGGVFIFDINTERGLKLYATRPAFAEEHRNGFCIFEATSLGKNRYRLDLRLLKKQPGRNFRLYKTSIRELAVPTETVLAAAEKRFRAVHVSDAERKRPSKSSEELYFVCRK